MSSSVLARMPRRKFTPEEYLALELDSPEKNEYYEGEIFSMAGATRSHNVIAGNVFAALHGRLKASDCQAYSSDMMIGVSPRGPFFYADVSAGCGKPKMLDSSERVLLNPALIVEVLSKSTAAFDRGLKLENYKQIASLKSALLVSQDRPSVVIHARHGSAWGDPVTISGLDKVVQIPSLSCIVSVADIYDRVELPGSRTRN